MGIKRRLLEGRREWLKRCLLLDGVSFAVGKDSNFDDHIYYYHASGDSYAGVRRVQIDKPSVGHLVIKDDDLKTTLFDFCTDKYPSTLSDVAVYQDNAGIKRMLMTLRTSALHLKDGMGYHVYTDPDGIDWYITNKSNDAPKDGPNRIRLHSGAKHLELKTHYRGVGDVYLTFCHMYQGKWEFTEATLDNAKPVHLFPEEEKKEDVSIGRYKLDETSHSDPHWAIALVKRRDDGIEEVTKYALNITLNEELEQAQHRDLSPLIHQVFAKNWYGQIVLRESYITWTLGDVTVDTHQLRMIAPGYYNSMKEGDYHCPKPYNYSLTLRGPVLRRQVI